MFTRQEALVLSGLSSGKLSYLDKKGIVTPQKLGNSVRPTCLYTWEQLLELRIIHRLRQDASLQQLRQAMEYLKNIGDTESLASKTVVALNNKIIWYQIDWEK
jgi:DNA-binding transcriptional MerR regulator